MPSFPRWQVEVKLKNLAQRAQALQLEIATLEKTKKESNA